MLAGDLIASRPPATKPARDPAARLDALSRPFRTIVEIRDGIGHAARA